MMPTSRIQQVTRSYGQTIAYERGAMGGYSEFDRLTDCKTKPYRQGDKLFVPSFKRVCVKAWADDPEDSATIDEAIIGQISQYINTTLDGSNVGLINQFRKVFTDRYKTYGAIPEHDPSISISNPDPVDPNKKYTKPGEKGPVETLTDILRFLADPVNWFAMLMIVLGFGILLVAIWKGLQ